MAEARRTRLISEAIAMVDTSLVELPRRELIATAQVADLLLDLRLLLLSAAEEEDPASLAVG